LEAGAKVNLKMMDYEGKCRSAPFQLALRECAKVECSADEYEFTEVHAKEFCNEFGIDIDKVLAENQQG